MTNQRMLVIGGVGVGVWWLFFTCAGRDVLNRIRVVLKLQPLAPCCPGCTDHADTGAAGPLQAEPSGFAFAQGPINPTAGYGAYPGQSIEIVQQQQSYPPPAPTSYVAEPSGVPSSSFVVPDKETIAPAPTYVTIQPLSAPAPAATVAPPPVLRADSLLGLSTRGVLPAPVTVAPAVDKSPMVTKSLTDVVRTAIAPIADLNLKSSYTAVADKEAAFRSGTTATTTATRTDRVLVR